MHCRSSRPNFNLTHQLNESLSLSAIQFWIKVNRLSRSIRTHRGKINRRSKTLCFNRNHGNKILFSLQSKALTRLSYQMTLIRCFLRTKQRIKQLKKRSLLVMISTKTVRFVKGKRTNKSGTMMLNSKQIQSNTSKLLSHADSTTLDFSSWTALIWLRTTQMLITQRLNNMTLMMSWFVT